VNCANCGVTLYGRYCADCGQRRESAPPTVGHLVAETFETLTHADSRLWRTLRALLTRPGTVTLDYFAGRRARHLPPLRLYIVASVTCFLLLALLPSRGPQADPAAQPTALERPGGAADLRPPVGSDAVAVDVDEAGCRRLQVAGIGDGIGAALQSRLRDACLRMVRDGGKGLGEAFLRGLPKAMFVLLPVFALLPLAFYWRPRRLYVEHLVLLVHNHSALFIALSAQQILALVLPAGAAAMTAPLLVAAAAWYVYRSMRTFYGEPRGRTLMKATALGFLYLFFASSGLAFTALAALLSL
jgi:hypothetical protein